VLDPLDKGTQLITRNPTWSTHGFLRVNSTERKL
jgi:hypothetical protein